LIDPVITMSNYFVMIVFAFYVEVDMCSSNPVHGEMYLIQHYMW